MSVTNCLWAVLFVAYNSDLNLLVSGGMDPFVLFWSPDGTRSTNTIKGKNLHSVLL